MNDNELIFKSQLFTVYLGCILLMVTAAARNIQGVAIGTAQEMYTLMRS